MNAMTRLRAWCGDEASIAAVLGYLKHMLEDDSKYKVKRPSLKGLKLPKEKT